MSSTIRKFLGDQFDWSTGTVVIQKTSDSDSAWPGWADPTSAYVAKSDDPILDVEFNAGFGGPECPRYFARDSMAVYFPSQYDGATSGERVVIDPTFYLNINNPTPYPGG